MPKKWLADKIGMHPVILSEVRTKSACIASGYGRGIAIGDSFYVHRKARLGYSPYKYTVAAIEYRDAAGVWDGFAEKAIDLYFTAELQSVGWVSLRDMPQRFDNVISVFYEPIITG